MARGCDTIDGAIALQFSAIDYSIPSKCSPHRTLGFLLFGIKAARKEVQVMAFDNASNNQLDAITEAKLDTKMEEPKFLMSTICNSIRHKQQEGDSSSN